MYNRGTILKQKKGQRGTSGPLLWKMGRHKWQWRHRSLESPFLVIEELPLSCFFGDCGESQIYISSYSPSQKRLCSLSEVEETARPLSPRGTKGAILFLSKLQKSLSLSRKRNLVSPSAYGLFIVHEKLFPVFKTIVPSVVAKRPLAFGPN